jgi:hypothetical protein
LPADARFDRREHVLCVDEAGKVKREKKVRHSTWSRYDDGDDGDMQNVSLVKQTGIHHRKKRPRTEIGWIFG